MEQVLLSNEALQKVKDSELFKENQKFVSLGKFDLPNSTEGAHFQNSLCVTLFTNINQSGCQVV